MQTLMKIKIKIIVYYYLKSLLEGNNLLLQLFLNGGKIFQNFKVLSPAPVTILCPSGDKLKYNTLKLCPVKVAIFCIFGNFQTFI